MCIAGLVNIFQGKTKNLDNAFDGSSTQFTAYATALYGGMWSFDGWNQLSEKSEKLFFF